MKKMTLFLTLLLSFSLAALQADTLLTRCYHHRKHKKKTGRSTRTHHNKQYHIVIDPGHGGEDFGTYSRTKPRQHEKYFTLTTSYMLRDYLLRKGYDVRLTRLKDENISLQQRVDFAAKNKAHLFVSVHYNSAPSDQAHGIEVFYFKDKENPKRTKSSTQLAELTLNNTIRATQAKSRGVKHGNFKVIRETTMPAILVEGGFLTNKEELEKLKHPDYLNKIAQAVASAVDEYIHQAR